MSRRHLVYKFMTYISSCILEFDLGDDFYAINIDRSAFINPSHRQHKPVKPVLKMSKRHSYLDIFQKFALFGTNDWLSELNRVLCCKLFLQHKIQWHYSL